MGLIDRGRFDELCQALGKEQVLMLVELLPVSYDEERARLMDAVKNKDVEGVKRSAHTIKGMAGNMAASTLEAQALALESFDGDFGNSLDEKIRQFDQLVGETVEAMKEIVSA